VFDPIKKTDLQEPDLHRLNRMLDFLLERVSALEGAAGTYTFRIPIQAQSMRLRDAGVPATSDGVLTLGAAIDLFGAKNVRQALDDRSDRGEPLKPLPLGGGGGAAGAPIFSLYPITISAGVTNIVSPFAPVQDAGLIVVITQDASGGGRITWESTQFVAYTPVDIRRLPNTVSVFVFFGHDNGGGLKWWFMTLAITGGTP